MERIRNGVLLALGLFLATASKAQQTMEATVVNGRIVDKLTKQSVVGKITYESLPYGSKIGIFRDSTFIFNLENGADYSLIVEADGYSPYIATIQNADVNDTIDKLVELSPKGENQLIRLDRLIFARGKDEITEVSYEELDQLAAMLMQNEDMVIQLEGHTDFHGNAKQNMRLSERRVVAVRNYLVKKRISKKRIKTKAFGGTKPLSRSNDEEARSKNRRVEVRILSN